MRTGIVTQIMAKNYGGILQNWALQQVLKDLGHEPVTIDVGLKYSFSRYLLGCANVMFYNFLGKHRLFPQIPFRGKSIPKITGEFIFQNILTTKPMKEYSSQIIEKYNIEALIVGSDQVWRPLYNSSIEDMFLRFASNCLLKSRISYAASFGVDTWEYSIEETNRCADLAKTFNAISVREVSGVKMCEEYFGVHATHVLDPTMLLPIERYLKLCDHIEVEKEPFMAVYCLDSSTSFNEKVKEKATQLDLVPKYFSAHSKLSLSIPQWLAMFRDASFIMTDSFHGTVFSILFNKPFVVIKNDARGNARIESLLSTFSVNENFDNSIDWFDINSKLLKLRGKSLYFLKDNLK